MLLEVVYVDGLEKLLVATICLQIAEVLLRMEDAELQIPLS